MTLAGCCLVARGEKPGLKLQKGTDGRLVLAPDLPPGNRYKIADAQPTPDGSKTWVTYAWVIGGDPDAGTYLLPYRLDGVTPGPTPEPKPQPDPKPTPEPVPVAQVWLLVVEETSQRTAPQAVVLASPKVRESVAGRIMLLDQSWALPDARQSYLDAAKGKTLPQMFLVPGDPQTTPASKAVYSGALPVAVEEMVLLIGKWQKGGK